jgi:hypothetical protein
MKSVLFKLFALGLLVVTAWMGYHDSRRLGGDDVLAYHKISGVVFGEAPPTGGRDLFIYNKVSPREYQVHPGFNVPYGEVPIEYPPFSLPFFFAPRLLSSDIASYTHFFGLQMWLYVVLISGCMWFISRRISARPLTAWGTVALACGFASAASWVISRRFDTSVALLVAAAITAEISGRSTAAAALLGLGAATKLWPAFLVPVLLLSAWSDGDRRRAVRVLLVSIGAFLLPHVPFLILGGPKAFSYLAYHGDRGLQIESVAGNLAMVLGQVTSVEVHLESNFGAVHVGSVSGWTQWLVRFTYVAMLLAFAFVLKRTWEGCRQTTPDSMERRRLVVFSCTALILATLITAKVFSTQFIIWLFPWVLLIPGGTRLKVAAIAMAWFSYLGYPVLYFTHLTKSLPEGIAVVLIRNILVLWLFFEAFRAMKVQAPAVSEAAEPQLAV